MYSLTISVQLGGGSIGQGNIEEDVGSFNNVGLSEIEDVILSSIRSRKKKKQFNKKNSSMREIQDKVLTSKEKQKRDRSSRKEKDKVVPRCEEKIVNLSLSDSDISNRRKESKLEIVSGDLIRRIWGDENFDFRYVGALGRSGGLITIWNKLIFLLKKEYCGNGFIMLEGNWLSEGWDGVLINVYAPNLLSEQRSFWEEMLMLMFRNQFSKHWIMGGDFNGITNKDERSNCVGLLKGSRDFGMFIDNCKLVDLPLMGKKFTWYGPDKKKSRLDRFLVEEE
ncbi:hypothetical protein CXB51_002210 [Gossypium anomalum]|uniref:Endonuclease/exonuclease/phosphatase domain-containing protein n=1 Tax=Gossypium anomalum TaxID=47600 RepID=A0A8J6DB17_9ROSI|nr:hypothetical protein CXB51_002210 [Gossypium anomalum]